MTLTELTYMHWFIIAALLTVLELFIPGVFIIWFGCGALIVGGLMTFLPLSVPLQIGIFAFSSLLFTIIVIKYFRKKQPSIHSHNLNKARGSEYINQTFTLISPVINGQGRIELGDSTWNILGIDCPIGTQITITGLDSNALRFSINDQVRDEL